MINPEWSLPAIGAAVAAFVTAGAVWMRPSGGRGVPRHTPPPLLMPDDPEADWKLAPVHQSALLIRYQEADGSVTESVMHPKTIRGEWVGHGRVRPRVVNAFCEATQSMRALRFSRILSAADLRGGEFIDDLYTYFGGAQPGGAPAPIYGRSTTLALDEHVR